MLSEGESAAQNSRGEVFQFLSTDTLQRGFYTKRPRGYLLKDNWKRQGK